MATQIVWDDDPPVEPALPKSYPTELDTLTNPALTKPYKTPTTVKELLEWADINDLIAELNKRGMVVSAKPSSYYMPVTVTTPITVPTVTTSAGTFTVPATTSTYTYSSLGQAQIMQNLATLVGSAAVTSSTPEPKVSTWKALIGRDK